MAAQPPTLDWSAIEAADPTGQMGHVLDLHNHLRDAEWRVESASLEEFEFDSEQPGSD